jgi:protein gp37
MAENTKIAWAHHSHNEWAGCTKVSPACDHCYAEAGADKRLHYVKWGGPRRLTTLANRRKPLKWQREAETAGVRLRVFANSWSDVFDNQVPSKWRDGLWETILQTPNIDWMLLTKRPQNIPKMLPSGWPRANVWLGTTAEDQVEWDRRVPELLHTEAVVHFVSVEPMLGPVSVKHSVDWVICGGESGAGFRVMDPEWARALCAQCSALGVSFFMKQVSAFNPKDG